MTQLLEKAFDQASQLPDEDQDTLAERLLAEIKAEKRWEKLFAESQEELGRLADEALADEERGRLRALACSFRTRFADLKNDQATSRQVS